MASTTTEYWTPGVNPVNATVSDVLVKVCVAPPALGMALTSYFLALHTRASGGTIVMLPEVPDVGTTLMTAG
jgi:hypothetical protein